MIVLDAEIKNHCPFGCQEVDERGYCRHLIGFTNNGRTLEPIIQIKDKEGELTGLVVVRGGKKTQEVLKGDKLVNPVHIQKDAQGLLHNANEWVSSRVYRDVPLKEDKRLTATAAAG